MSKSIRLVLLCVVAAAAIFVYLELNKTAVKAEMVWGTGTDSEQVHILNKAFEAISCTPEQYRQLQDDSYVNIGYVVVYEETKWLHKNKTALQIIRFEKPFPDNKLQPADTMYYKLVEETIHPVDEDQAVFIRLYERYETNHNLFGFEPVAIIVPRSDTVQEARSWLQINQPAVLKLLPLTVVDTTVTNSWQQEKYNPINEYSVESPGNLTIQDIIATKHAR
ncbi:MAG: hypothetical protein K0Q73_4015 [Paenibacillus sp.]|nr:hypothetical protein [Paenibacillus sp.]